ncbi:MAG TPA: hypothetical protein VM118_13715, partial [Acidobacteriota bacterium]|nr:hypothetical protein [Acidobacteriota bacterium]
MRAIHSILVFGLVVLPSVTAVAASSVVIESKTVPLSATGQTLGIYVVNEVALSGISFPLVFRS